MTLTELELKKHDLINTEESKRKKEGYLKALEIIERKAREKLQSPAPLISRIAGDLLMILEDSSDLIEKLIAIYREVERTNGVLCYELKSFAKEISDLVITSEAVLCNYCNQLIYEDTKFERFGNVRYHEPCYQEFLKDDIDYQKLRKDHLLNRIRSAAE